MTDSTHEIHRLVVDRSACAGHGMCYGASPDLLDSDDQGDPVVLRDPLRPEDMNSADSAVVVCPERALFVDIR